MEEKFFYKYLPVQNNAKLSRQFANCGSGVLGIGCSGRFHYT